MFVLEDCDDKDFGNEYSYRPGDDTDCCRYRPFLVTKPVTGKFSDRILKECLTAHAYDVSKIPEPEVRKT